MRSALLIDAPLLVERPPGAIAFLKRMNGANVGLVALGPVEAPAWVGAGVHFEYLTQRDGWRPKELLGALRAVDADPMTSWLVCGDASAIPAAATAGLAGVVLIGVEPPPGDHGLAVNAARDLADAPRALVPRGGGCWHERPTA